MSNIEDGDILTTKGIAEASLAGLAVSNEGLSCSETAVASNITSGCYEAILGCKILAADDQKLTRNI